MTVSLDSNLLEIIVCPDCKGPLKHGEKHLTCRRCRLSFPIDDKGVPVLIIDEALPLQADEEEAGPRL